MLMQALYEQVNKQERRISGAGYTKLTPKLQEDEFNGTVKNNYDTISRKTGDDMRRENHFDKLLKRALIRKQTKATAGNIAHWTGNEVRG
ncbi:unnamed protein product [Haemonchus placei]|uniref:Phage protein n=1 Tax=Haemonchus placei TaxID=6290 RepID=A0A0N4W8Z1_HAEPC|nr:unnamed protein product [Haemonchus placei]